MPLNVPPVADASRAARDLIALLWRHERPQPTRPGPRPRISVDAIVAAAIARADAEGLAAVTVRRVADDVGVKPMTFYSHVPDKDTLVALMLDQCLVNMPPSDIDSDLPARQALSRLVEANYRWYLAHPWLDDAHTEQPPPGPGVIGKYERELAIVVRWGLSDVDTDSVLTFLLDFARSAAVDATRAARSRTGNAEWWQAVGPVLAEVLDPERYPLSQRIGGAAGAALGGAYDADHAYRFGRDRVLDAVEALLESAGRIPR